MVVDSGVLRVANDDSLDAPRWKREESLEVAVVGRTRDWESRSDLSWMTRNWMVRMRTSPQKAQETTL